MISHQASSADLCVLPSQHGHPLDFLASNTSNKFRVNQRYPEPTEIQSNKPANPSISWATRPQSDASESHNYESKSLIIKEGSEFSHHHSYDWSDDEFDHDYEDEDDEYGHSHDLYGGKKKGRKKKKKVVYKVKTKKKKKKKYPKKVKIHYGKKYHAEKYPKKKKKKKKSYAYVINPGKGHYSYGKSHHSSRISFAGLFGYTLLCVNYLMMLQQPEYEKYSHTGHHDHDYYSSASYHAHKLVEPKGGHKGPIILAHCSSEFVDPNWSAMMGTKSRQLRHLLDSLESSASDANSSGLAGPGINSAASWSPLLTPTIQTYLSQFVWPQNQQQNQQVQLQTEPARDPSSMVMDDQADFVIVGNQNRLLSGLQGDPASSRLINPNVRGGRRIQVINLEGQPEPQLVARRDNLLASRSGVVEVSMRIVGRPGFNLGQREFEGPLGGRRMIFSSINDQLNDQADRMQADQPRDSSSRDSITTGTTPTARQQNSMILDLPDYAMAGDSIELTCRHRMPLNRLYSVKWFKDSLEFYRFIPANGPRTKSSLFLPDVRLDLARSNSETLYLRNVSHRSSGLYRCEVVSGEYLRILKAPVRCSNRGT